MPKHFDDVMNFILQVRFRYLYDAARAATLYAHYHAPLRHATFKFTLLISCCTRSSAPRAKGAGRHFLFYDMNLLLTKTEYSISSLPPPIGM